MMDNEDVAYGTQFAADSRQRVKRGTEVSEVPAESPASPAAPDTKQSGWNQNLQMRGPGSNPARSLRQKETPRLGCNRAAQNPQIRSGPCSAHAQ